MSNEKPNAVSSAKCAETQPMQSGDAGRTSQATNKPVNYPWVDAKSLPAHFIPRVEDGNSLLGHLLCPSHVRVVLKTASHVSVDMDSDGHILQVGWKSSEEFCPQILRAMIARGPFIPFSLILHDGEAVLIKTPESVLEGANEVAIRIEGQGIRLIPLDQIQSSMLHFHLEPSQGSQQRHEKSP
jgi:hypothetical protein